MDARTSRRHFLYGGAVAGAGIWLPADVREADARARKKVPLARSGAFTDGVLSGDPSPTAVTLWTRLDENPRDRLRVELEVARDPGFRRVVLRRLVPTRASRDHTVKVRVGGLKPDRRCYPGQRTELLSHIEARQVKDVVFVTGDIHTFFAGEVRRDGKSGPAVASELVGGSTTSPGTAQVIAHTAGGVLPPDLVEPLSDEGVPRLNPWITYADTRTHGCALVTLSEAEVRARYLGSADVTTLEGSRDVRQIAELRVARGTPGVEVVSRA